MASETDVATAALAIAISALVIAAGQLIAQLFSTADGYRRCQPSVIGDWYKLVELKFWWTSFRFEVKVTTPHFVIRPMDDYQKRQSFLLDQNKPLPGFPRSLFKQRSRYLIPPHLPAPLLNTTDSRRGTFCEKTSEIAFLDELAEDVASWVNLLEDVHRCQSKGIGPPLMSYKMLWTADLAPIGITRETRSWDFMPPDIVRPVASTTLGCLLTMAYRMQMTWTDFRLDEGKICASGSGRSFSTSMVRGMGLVVEYDRDKPFYDLSNRGHVPSTAADQMTFGIMAGGFSQSWSIFRVHLRNMQSPTAVDLDQPSAFFKLPRGVKATLEASLSHLDPAHRLPAFTDAIGLWCGWLVTENLKTNKIDNPFPFPLTTMGERPESRNVWRSVLREREATLSVTSKQVLRFYDDWEDRVGPRFVENYRLDASSHSEIAFFKTAFDNTTTYLDGYLKTAATKSCTPFVSPHIYIQLISTHICVNVHSVEKAKENVKSNVVRGQDLLPNNLDPVFVERAYIYAENIPKFAEEMGRTPSYNPHDDIPYEEIWWMMMMRLHAWTMSVNWVDRGGVKIPSGYYDSVTRVYIL